MNRNHDGRGRGPQSGSSSSRRRIICMLSITLVGILALTNNLLFHEKVSLLTTTESLGLDRLVVASSSSSTTTTTSSSSSHQLAYDESFGLIHDVTDEGWMLLKERVLRQRQNENLIPPLTEPIKGDLNMAKWYGNHFEPEFTCLHEERIGGAEGKGNGDGPKWICNPRRIQQMSKETYEQTGQRCLIYSIGSKGKFDFEESMAALLEVGNNPLQLSCEIHVFDMDDYSNKLSPKYKDTIIYHKWGLTKSKDDEDDNNNNPSSSRQLRRRLQKRQYYSLQEIIKQLGHEGRTIDIFKIDCEGCEWTTYKDWILADVEIRQIQVEVHDVPSNAIDFFTSLQNAGYVIFHKEPNTISRRVATCVEYSFLKLKSSFFDNISNNQDEEETSYVLAHNHSKSAE